MKAEEARSAWHRQLSIFDPVLTVVPDQLAREEPNGWARRLAIPRVAHAYMGMPADVSWHLGELKGEAMESSTQRASVIT